VKDLQRSIDASHTAAGLKPQRKYELTEHFKESEEGPDEVIDAHNGELKKKAELNEQRQQFNIGLKMMLAAADGLASVRREQ
jgi:hypothetical protein